MLKQKSNVVNYISMFVLAGSLAACGGKSNVPANAPSSETDSVVTEEVPDEIPVEEEKMQPDVVTESSAPQHSTVVKQQPVRSESIHYDGRIGRDDVHVLLSFKDNVVSGVVTYDESAKKYKVSGALDADGNIQLNMFAQSKKVGRLVGVKHRRMRRFSGNFLAANGDSFTFKFSKTSSFDDGDDIYQ